mgnify:CR=1 FL=1
MEDLTQKIEELIKVLKTDSMPLWVSIIGIFVPILLSAIVIVITVLQNKKNKEFQIQLNKQNERLQIQISEKELKVQMHGDILKIYDECCVAQSKICGFDHLHHIIFSALFTSTDGKDLDKFYVDDLHTALSLLCQATNRANLLFPKNDIKIRNIIETIYKKSQALSRKADDYLYMGIADNIRDIAWDKISNKFNIPKGNYGDLNNNMEAKSAFSEYCKTTTTKEMDDIREELIELFKYDNFDVYFEKYLQMKFENGEN